ncbi:VanW family protein [Chthoniobacter flavus Ellin428]|uniref:VanW family protein n=1 Tax=Chthoniobacter flavus Ellin428 TaxID=497964 RepID=B4CVV8_9BACT|nr:VanW family protein [Chthoniobacter flavus]EDY21550.1 VanW family protein [Chthoniobacter flavus Ellin428]TCO95495.1 glycosyl transferase family 1 [Chthoniobacter flavus]
MSSPSAHPIVERPREALPSRGAALLFRLKATCFQAWRGWSDLTGDGPRRHPKGEQLARTPIVGTQSGDIWFETTVASEKRLQFGKVQNLRVSAATFHGTEVPANRVWSFWRQLGRTTARKGFAVGRELREGCLIPTLGGGLCQLSGAIYNAALEAGLEIVERHAHSHPGVGNLAAVGRDATVFWNYVDLRLRAPFPWRLEVELSSTRLTVRIRSTKKEVPDRLAPTRGGRASLTTAAQPGSCASCGVAACFRHLKPDTDDNPGRTAWVVDEWWPEWASHLAQLESPADLLLRPLDGYRWRKPNYAWDVAAFRSAQSATLLTLRRAWSTRRLREQGAERQRALLAWDERLARHYARQLQPEHTHLVVAQNLLPFLWHEGVLGGRTFDVLMVRMPIQELQAQLDLAARLHPDSTTCADFRAPKWLGDAEAQALAAAEHWITPHRAIADLSSQRAIALPWKMPAASKAESGNAKRVVFPASTLGRKGAYELREAARALDLELVCLGGIIERPDFWSGIKLGVASSASWFDGAAAVVLPAFVEHRPRRLLTAISAGVPVIATPQCGLGSMPGVTEVPAGDAAALAEALRNILSRSQHEAAAR